jgi:peptidoglycan/xylan/chitin deacetylase (PgdA/CDA1 family)
VYDLGDSCRFRGRRRTVAETIRAIADEGHEIGLHGGFHTSTDASALTAERDALQRATGLELTTSRQHLLRWDARASPLVQAEAGLRVDSSVWFNRNIGFRAGTSLPFRPFDFESGETVDVLELPLVLQDGPLLEPDGLDLNRELAADAIAQTLGTVESVGGVATVLFHPHSLDDADFVALYRRTIELAVERGAWIATLGEIAAWWRGREERLGLR